MLFQKGEKNHKKNPKLQEAQLCQKIIWKSDSKNISKKGGKDDDFNIWNDTVAVVAKKERLLNASSMAWLSSSQKATYVLAFSGQYHATTTHEKNRLR